MGVAQYSSDSGYDEGGSEVGVGARHGAVSLTGGSVHGSLSLSLHYLALCSVHGSLCLCFSASLCICVSICLSVSVSLSLSLFLSLSLPPPPSHFLSLVFSLSIDHVIVFLLIIILATSCKAGF